METKFTKDELLEIHSALEKQLKDWDSEGNYYMRLKELSRKVMTIAEEVSEDD